MQKFPLNPSKSFMLEKSKLFSERNNLSYNKNFIKIGDMRVDFYTYDVRNLGQGVYAAHKIDASERTSQKPTKTLVVLVESEALLLQLDIVRLCGNIITETP